MRVRVGGGHEVEAGEVLEVARVGTDAPSVFCSLFGAGEPFTDEQLADLYDSHEDYVGRVTDSADAAVEAGGLLPEDRDAMIADAEAADVP